MGGLFTSFLTTFIILFAVYMLASTAGLISEKSGTVNIAIDGTMIMGALAYASMASWDAYWNAFGVMAPFVTLFFAMLVGMIYAQLLSFATINLMADQVITGTALNLFAPALSLILLFQYFKLNQIIIPATTMSWYVIPLIFLILALLIILFISFLLTKTTFGLRLKAVGENPYALETAGHSVYKMRWQALTIAGALAGLAGGMFIFYNSGSFAGTVNGAGFIALAIVIFGQWKIKGIVLGSFILAFIGSLALLLMLLVPEIPYEIMNIIPFVIPILILCIFKSKKGPKSSGIPFKKDSRE